MPLFETGQDLRDSTGHERRLLVPPERQGVPGQALQGRLGGGKVGEDSRQMNDDAIEAERNGEPTDRLFSLYSVGDREIYIITEWDRSATTVLFPEEY